MDGELIAVGLVLLVVAAVMLVAVGWAPTALDVHVVAVRAVGDVDRVIDPQTERDGECDVVEEVHLDAAVGRDQGLAGLADDPVVMTGSELDAVGEEELGARLRDIDVFARVLPAQKLRIVNALKRRHEVVAERLSGVLRS